MKSVYETTSTLDSKGRQSFAHLFEMIDGFSLYNIITILSDMKETTKLIAVALFEFLQENNF